METECKYIKMRTISRFNYRSECDLSANSLRGTLENNVIIEADENFLEFHYGFYWRKIKIDKKTYYAVSNWLKKV